MRLFVLLLPSKHDETLHENGKERVIPSKLAGGVTNGREAPE